MANLPPLQELDLIFRDSELTGLVALIRLLVSNDQGQVLRAQALFDLALRDRPDSLLLALSKLLSSVHPDLRAEAARHLGEIFNDFILLEGTTLDTLKSALLYAFRNEMSKPNLDILFRTISDFHATGSWPELLPYLFQCVDSQSHHLQEYALLVFKSLAENPNGNAALIHHLNTFREIFSECLVNCWSWDVKIAAWGASISFVQFMSDPEDPNRFDYLLGLMMLTLTEALNSGSEYKIEESLPMLIKLAKTDPGFFERQLKKVLRLMLKITVDDNFEVNIKRLAIKFLMALVEKAPRMISEQPLFIERMFDELMYMLFDIEGFHDATVASAADANHTVAVVAKYVADVADNVAKAAAAAAAACAAVDTVAAAANDDADASNFDETVFDIIAAANAERVAAKATAAAAASAKSVAHRVADFAAAAEAAAAAAEAAAAEATAAAAAAAAGASARSVARHVADFAATAEAAAAAAEAAASAESVAGRVADFAAAAAAAAASTASVAGRVADFAAEAAAAGGASAKSVARRVADFAAAAAEAAATSAESVTGHVADFAAAESVAGRVADFAAAVVSTASVASRVAYFADAAADAADAADANAATASTAVAAFCDAYVIGFASPAAGGFDAAAHLAICDDADAAAAAAAAAAADLAAAAASESAAAADNDGGEVEIFLETKNYRFGKKCLSKFSSFLGEEPIFLRVIHLSSRLLGASMWQWRHAALIAIQTIAKSCHKVMLENLDKIVPGVLKSLNDLHPYVRLAAINAITQLSVDFGSKLQTQYHDMVLIRLHEVMKDFLRPKLQAAAFSAALSFLTNGPKSIIYLYKWKIIDEFRKFVKDNFFIDKSFLGSELAKIVSLLESDFQHGRRAFGSLGLYLGRRNIGGQWSEELREEYLSRVAWLSSPGNDLGGRELDILFRLKRFIGSYANFLKRNLPVKR